MNNIDRDSLIALLNETKDIFQDISRRIYWTEADTARLDDLMYLKSKGLHQDIASRIAKATGSSALTEYTRSFLAYKAWQRTKAVYSFNREFVEDMSQTEDTKIYTSLFERLPFRDMLFFFPREVLPVLEDEIAGIYVHIEPHPEILWINFNCLNRIYQRQSQFLPGIEIGFPITNGMKISHIFETQEYLQWLSAYKRVLLYYNQLSEQRFADLELAERRVLNTAFNLIYYLSSKNADIKEIKHRKKQSKASSVPKENGMPAVKLHEVGTQYPEIIFRQLKADTVTTEDDKSITNENAATRTVKSTKKRRPHARRAHWQHYWTGKGRTTLELRWKPDIFVGGNRDNQPTIVYDIEKESSKGKQNPNTSKKKRNK